jgi:hypothetical protein
MEKDTREGNGGVSEVSDDLELTREEKMAFQSLPREAEASDLLEERIVRSLREEGILRESGATVGEADRALPPGRGLWIKPWMAVAVVAASLALFTSGIFLGQTLGTRSTAQAFLAVREQDAAQLAMTIQEAGSQYVSALAALSELRVADPGVSGGGESGVFSVADLQQGREVAMGTLYGAAYELARMSPDDVEVMTILRILEARREREEGGQGVARNVVWF